MIQSFLNYLQFEKRVSLNTLVAYQSDLLQFSDFLLKTYPDDSIAEAPYQIVRSWIIELVEHDVDPRSVNRKTACLRSFYKFLMKREVIQVDPVSYRRFRNKTFF